MTGGKGLPTELGWITVERAQAFSAVGDRALVIHVSQGWRNGSRTTLTEWVSEAEVMREFGDGEGGKAELCFARNYAQGW